MRMAVHSCFDEERKRRLLDLGKWGDFLLRRDELRLGGMGKKEADDRSYCEMVGEEYVGKASRKSSVAKVSSASSAAVAKSVPAVPSSPSVSVPSASPVSDDGGAIVVGDVDFAGKRCARSHAIEWAYVHASMGGVKPEDAPSALAWCLMMDFRKSAAYKYDLFRAVAAKAVAKEEPDAQDYAAAIDGQEEYDILARLAGGDGQ